MTANLPTPANRPALIKAAVPSLAGDLLASVMATLGADPVTSTVAGSMLTTAMGLDTVGHAARQQRACDALTIAADQLGGRDQLVDLALSDPARLELLVRILEASARTTVPEKISALGRVLAQGIQDDQVDEALFLAAALADLEAPHVQVLAAIQKNASQMQVAAAPYTGTIGWTELQVTEAFPRHRLVLPSIVRVLVLHGLVRDLTAPGAAVQGPRYVISELGDRCLALLTP